MTTEPEIVQSQLAPPGAGLPVLQTWVARCIVFPLACARSSWPKAMRQFLEQGQACLTLARPLTEAQLERRVLVPPLRGIEDSSRFWSAGMTLEHLIFVGSRFCEVMLQLGQGKLVNMEINPARAKPRGGRGVKIIAEFEAFLEKYTDAVAHRVVDRNSRLTHRHPWFGDLNAYQWHVLTAQHQGIHRRQLEEITRRLKSEK